MVPEFAALPASLRRRRPQRRRIRSRKLPKTAVGAVERDSTVGGGKAAETYAGEVAHGVVRAPKILFLD